MDPTRRKLCLSIVLAVVAGFCDTTTFVSAQSLLSAHITGNLVLFAADLVHHTMAHAWIRLVSLPIFMLTVLLTRLLSRVSSRPSALLHAEAGLLIGAGLAAFSSRFSFAPAWLSELAVLTVVVAMALQNAFGGIYQTEIYGPTTVMTGKLTQVLLSWTAAAKDAATAASLNAKTALLIFSGFVLGCVLGAGSSSLGGLTVVIIPGLFLLLYASWQARSQARTYTTTALPVAKL